MEAPVRILRRSSKKSKCFIASGVMLLIAIVVGVAVGVGVSLSEKKEARSLLTTILVPLYIYPNPGSWDPLFRAIGDHPSQKFIVVINPHSGPGSNNFPSVEYTTQIQNLSRHNNVQTVGYVRAGYGTRNIDDVLADISTYSGWETMEQPGVNKTALAMRGIFFDEAPHEYDPDTVDYMSTINKAAKDATGILPPKTIIHNPGTLPDARLTDSNTDITVVFEQSYNLYQQQTKSPSTPSKARSDRAIIIHSVPEKTNLRHVVDKLAVHAENLFLTDLSEDYYQRFGHTWSQFVDDMI